MTAAAHRGLFLATLSLLLAGLCHSLAHGTEALLCLPIVVFLGLPHGATDLWCAARILPSVLGGYWLPLFVGAYLLIGVVTAAGIVLAPHAALIIFFLVAIKHFGDVDAFAIGGSGLPLAWLACGLLPIATPLAFWPGDVAAILREMGSPFPVSYISTAGIIGLATAAILGLSTGLWHIRLWWLQSGTLLFIFVVAPPIPAFTVYFCLLHAPRHFGHATPGGFATIVVAVLTAAALIAVPIYLLVMSGNIPMSAGLVSGLFWGLAVLTIPHMVCEPIMARYRDVHRSRPVTTASGHGHFASNTRS